MTDLDMRMHDRLTEAGARWRAGIDTDAGQTLGVPGADSAERVSDVVASISADPGRVGRRAHLWIAALVAAVVVGVGALALHTWRRTVVDEPPASRLGGTSWVLERSAPSSGWAQLALAFGAAGRVAWTDDCGLLAIGQRVPLTAHAFRLRTTSSLQASCPVGPSAGAPEPELAGVIRWRMDGGLLRLHTPQGWLVLRPGSLIELDAAQLPGSWIFAGSRGPRGVPRARQGLSSPLFMRLDAGLDRVDLLTCTQRGGAGLSVGAARFVVAGLRVPSESHCAAVPNSSRRAEARIASVLQARPYWLVLHGALDLIAPGIGTLQFARTGQ